ncbi:MAG: hypothetical protein NTY99_00500 [DPANN group archaeon]|nr:hypothetical protein [DPANN group archaeon]
MKTTIALEDKVNEGLNKTIDIVLARVANLYNVPFEELQSVKPKEIIIDSQGESSGYNGKTNQFYLRKEDIDFLKRIDFWSEELAHFVRNYCVKESSTDVQEFFGGLARLAVGKAEDIALSDEDVALEELKATNKMLMAVLTKYSTALGRAFDKKPGQTLLQDITEEERVLKTIKQSYFDALITKKNCNSAYDLINKSKLADPRKRELRELLVKPDGLNKAIAEAEDFRSGIENMHDFIEAKDLCAEIDMDKCDVDELTARQHIYNVHAHQIGYDLAKKLYNSKGYVGLLETYPALIQLPDKTVRKLANQYASKPNGSLLQKIKAKIGSAKQ